MIEDWKKEIVVMIYVKQVLHDKDKSNLWDWHLPEVAATDEQLVAVEEHIGHALDSKHRIFLNHADGWRSFYQDVDLFGTSDLVGGERMLRATTLMNSASDALQASGLSSDDLLPIAVSNTDVDLFAIARPQSASPGVVVWFAGNEIEKFPDFDEYFLAMVDYNRYLIELAEREE